MTHAIMKHGDFTAWQATILAIGPAMHRVSSPRSWPWSAGLRRRSTSPTSAPARASGPRCSRRVAYNRYVRVEPNDEMRQQGILASQGHENPWREGTGEATELPAVLSISSPWRRHFIGSISMAGAREFQRILRQGGRFVALWNPRLIEVNPLLVEIEGEITRLKPDIRRVSSGRSGLTERLTEHAVG